MRLPVRARLRRRMEILRVRGENPIDFLRTTATNETEDADAILKHRQNI